MFLWRGWTVGGGVRESGIAMSIDLLLSIHKEFVV